MSLSINTCHEKLIHKFYLTTFLSIVVSWRVWKNIYHYIYHECYTLVCWTRILTTAFLSGDMSANVWLSPEANKTLTQNHMHHETRALSYCCDVAQLPLKTALPLSERIATASGRCSETGPMAKLSSLLRSSWGTFQHLISLSTDFAVGRVLSMRVL